jgi:Xaa-Pro dipeptidase
MRKPREMYFTMEEYEERMRKLRQEMSSRGIDVLMSFTPENIYYMSGYQTPGYYKYQCLVVPIDREPFMISRYSEETNVWGFSVLEDRAFFQDWEDPVEITVKAFEERGLAANKTIGIEEDAWFLSIKDYSKLKNKLLKVRTVDGSGCVEKLRMIKSSQEIDYIRQAARIVEKAMKAGIESIKEGVTDNNIAAAVHYELINNGGEYMGLPPFVCSGYRSGISHATWSGKRVAKGEPVFFEMSACVKRYSAPLERTAYLGAPPAEVLKIADVLIAGLNKAIETIKPGVTAGEADKACRDVVAKAGYGEHYRHRLGYSMGVNFPPDWGEGHIVSLLANDPTILKAGMVFHMPPALIGYMDRGTGLSETILVTKDGCEVLTNFERKLFIIE